ncbi:hypothetical protein HQO84_15505 [Rhodococcus fascians]|nr:hypothetical protein [Rhodococcus fascians]MBY3996666.1 hypothetical protein [Rhodococcus fascians]MBY4003187.1 hypothetical protein [Rhodococcus fascians]MBY4007937.1 hypothetical protein [Rhodococcus fascians]MBY4018178.1 hypothetical protein [Rhodococcus fascians]
MTVFAPLKLAHRETISPAQLGRTFCTEVAEQVPYWIAVLTPAERPLQVTSSPLRDRTTVTLPVPTNTHRLDARLLAALGSAASTWQRDNCRGSSSGVLVDIDVDDTGFVHPVRLPAVPVDALTEPARGSYLVDDVCRRLDSAPHGGRDYSLTRNYPALACRPGAQILFRHDAAGADAGHDEPSDYAIDIAIDVTGSGPVVARVTWSAGIEGMDELVRLWAAATTTLAAAPS